MHLHLDPNVSYQNLFAVNHQQMQAQPQQTLSVQAGQVAGASPQVIQLQPVSSVISRKKLLNSAVCLLLINIIIIFSSNKW